MSEKSADLRQIRKNLSLILVVAAFSILCLAAKEFSMPAAKPATSYPAHDQHSNEKVTVAIDLYDTPEKANIFSAHYGEVGIAADIRGVNKRWRSAGCDDRDECAIGDNGPKQAGSRHGG